MINKNQCIGCGACVNACPVSAIILNKENKAQINKELCIACGTCQAICPMEAIDIMGGND